MGWLRDRVAQVGRALGAPFRWADRRVEGKVKSYARKAGTEAGRKAAEALHEKARMVAPEVVQKATRTAVRTAAAELQHVAPQLLDTLTHELAESVERRVVENEGRLRAAVEALDTKVQYLVARTLLRLLLVALHAYLFVLLVPAAHAVATTGVGIGPIQRYAVLLGLTEIVLAFCVSIALPVLNIPPLVAPVHGAVLSLLVFFGVASFLSWSTLIGLWAVGSTEASAPAWAVSPLLPVFFAGYGGLVAVLTLLAVRHRRGHGASPAFLDPEQIIDFLRTWVAPPTEGRHRSRK